MNVSIISLSSDMEDSRFMASLQTKPRNSILLIEDVDTVRIHSNDDTKPNSRGSYYEKGLTLSSVLNALDGIVGQQGSVVFLTCNDTTKLAPALLRPGRVDKKLHLGLADEYQIRSMFERFFEVSNDKIVEKLVHLLPKNELAPAELQNFFMTYSLQDDMKHICDGVPEFLEGVRNDREQARLHAERTKQKRDIYGNLATPGSAPPTPSTDDDEKQEQDLAKEKENLNRRIIIDVKDDGQLCMASS
jgi:SpoVK/Ycf46/Vps4 family AAA+-type ATPase